MKKYEPLSKNVVSYTAEIDNEHALRVIRVSLTDGTELEYDADAMGEHRPNLFTHDVERALSRFMMHHRTVYKENTFEELLTRRKNELTHDIKIIDALDHEELSTLEWGEVWENRQKYITSLSEVEYLLEAKSKTT